MAEKNWRARINPSLPCNRYAIDGRIYFKERGWYEVSEATAGLLAKQPLHIQNPEQSPSVFQIMPLEIAEKLEEQEQRKEVVRGTVRNPASATPRRGGLSEEQARQAAAAASIKLVQAADAPPTPADDGADEPLMEAGSEPPESLPEPKKEKPKRVGRRRAKA